jgi:type I restriction enzyme S subunit
MNISLNPKKRFLGFSGIWSECDLQKTSIKNISYGVVQTGDYIEDGIPCVRVVDLTKGNIDRNNLIKTSSKISQAYKKTILEIDELIIALRGEIGLSQRITSDLVGCNLTRGIARISPDLKQFDSKYLEVYLNSDSVRKIFDQRKNGSALKEIPISELKKIPVRYPEYKEQQKIGDFLFVVDRKISLLKEKHALLEQYKKGVMQKLFSQEIRFKDENGNEFPDWQDTRLDNVFQRVIQKNKENNQNVLTISAQRGLINQEKYFNKSVSAKDVTGYYLLNGGDFAYNKSYSKGYPMGAIKRLNNYDKGVVSTLYICFKSHGNQHDAFWEQYFEAGLLNREISKIAQEGARNHGLLNVSVTEFFRDIIVHEPSEKEQVRIAEFLGTLDKKLKLVSQQIKLTQTFKKGLLQQMFV